MPPKSAARPARPAAILPGHDGASTKALLNDPKFRSLASLAAEDMDDSVRLVELLKRLDDVYDRASGRQRTVGRDQAVIMDPDSNACVKVVEAAAAMLGVKVRAKPPGSGLFDASAFTAKPDEAA